QQFASQVATPIALALLSAYEAADLTDPPAVERRTVASFFRAAEDGEGVPEAPVEYVNAEVRRAGVEDFDLRLLELPVDVPEIDRTVRSVFLEMLQTLGEMVWRYRCDLMLLSGRPSRLPAVAAILRETACLSPTRIVPLHSFRVGRWYPFRDARATISDPKTTAAVGAMICLLAEGHLPNFNFRSDLLKPASTARFFGKLDRNNRLLKADEFYADMQLEDPEWVLPDAGFEFRGPMPLGFRQMAVDWWPASRLYSLAYAEGADVADLQRRTPLHVQLRRDKAGDRRAQAGSHPIDMFKIQRIEDKDGGSVGALRLRLRLQTIDNQTGYWLDTGVLLDQ
ncbi:MAG TPA: virulence factor SrfB, partial [Thalassobaculum sp.]